MMMNTHFKYLFILYMINIKILNFRQNKLSQNINSTTRHLKFCYISIFYKCFPYFKKFSK